MGRPVATNAQVVYPPKEIGYHFLAMLLGFLENIDDKGSLSPVYLPSHLTCYVDKKTYDVLLGNEVAGFKAEGAPSALEILEVEGKDPVPEIRDTLKNGGAVCLRLLKLDESLARRIALAFPDESIYILDESLRDFSSRPISEPEPFGKDEKACFDDFVSDVTGYRRKTKVTPRKHAYQSHYGETISTPKIVQKPKIIEKGEEKEPIITKALILAVLKRDGLNFLFAMTFVILTFLTSIGYFFLGASSNTFFGVICLIMAIVFPMLSAVPIGFLYVDNERRLHPFPLTLFFWFALYAFFVVVFSFVVLALGNGNGWDHPRAVTHFFLNLSPLLWSVVRILVDPLVRKYRQ